MQLSCPENANMMMNDGLHTENKQMNHFIKKTDSYCAHLFRNTKYINNPCIYFIYIDRYIHTYIDVKIVRTLKKHYVVHYI